MARFIAVPLKRDEAQAFIRQHHRHHTPSLGDVFRVGLELDESLIAVAMVGRPVSRRLDDGMTLEVSRSCLLDIPEAKHAASALYAKCWRIAKELGYTRLLTYTMADETGTSLVAAGWKVVHQTSGGKWSRATRPRRDTGPLGPKTLWEAS